MTEHVALDLFAGTGWGVACKALGIAEHGVELMPAAVATREANGMRTAFTDVWDGLRMPHLVPQHDVLIASPPCQTFSMAGGGAGRRALDEVLALIESGAWLDPDELQSFGHEHDDRTALVLTPLTYAMRYRPRVVVLEQVPPVLPVWQAVGRVLAMNGYQVATGVLSAEQYGVPQTRKRAILVAVRGGAALLPTPTHSRYYSNAPDRLDLGVLPWVSMAEALGWGMTERPYLTVAAGTSNGGTDPAALGGSGSRRILNRERSEGRWVHGTPDNGGDFGRRRPIDAPAATVTSKVDRTRIVEAEQDHSGRWVAQHHRGAGMVERYGTRPPRELTEPAFTIRSGGGTAPGGFRLQYLSQSGDVVDPDWPANRPATTVAGRDVVGNPGANANRFNGATKSRNDGVKLTEQDAAVLQSYPRDFTWVGGKTSTFQQIGNAVPPLLAEAVLRAVLDLD